MPQIVTTKDGKRHEFPDGATPEQMKAALASYAPKIKPAVEVFGPAATERRWKRVIPWATGMAGAMLPPPFGGLAGATVGGMAGRALELGIAGEMPKELAPAIRQIGGAGVEQAILQAPASALGPIARGAGGIRQWARGRAVNQALKEVNLPRQAARSTKIAELNRRVPEATAARQSAAAATSAELAGAQGQEITAIDLADRIIADREARFGLTAAPKIRSAIYNDVVKRLRTVLPKHTGRLLGVPRGPRPPRAGFTTNVTVPPVAPKIAFDMPTSQIGKQAFDDLVRAAHTGAESGIRPHPAIDMDIANAWRGLIEDRVPAVQGLNQTTRAAIRTEQSLRRLQKNLPTEQAQRVRTQELDASTAARVLAQRSANPFQLFKGIPVRGGFARPGLSLRPGTFSEALGKLGDVAGSAPAEGTAFYLPRVLALLKIMQEQKQLFNGGEMPPDTLRNQ